MKNYIEERKAILLEEAKEELDLCNLEWDDNFLDCFNYTPSFGYGDEEHASFFHGCMRAIKELDLVLEGFNQ